jgi:predicted outer membrane repeat protein
MWAVVQNSVFQNSTSFADAISIPYVQPKGGGGAIAVVSIQNVNITNCYFEHNNADLGGAINLHTVSNVSIHSCTLKSNSAKTHGGGIYVGYKTYYLNIYNTSMIANRAVKGSGGAIYIDQYASDAASF